MTVGILKVSIFIPDSHSLKEKRFVLHSLKARLRRHFNVAVSQIDDEDKWQRSTLAIVGIENNRADMNSLLSKVINFIERYNVDIIDYAIELI
ncbi:MAG: DUF503 domain-containing protein [Candidatus Omnitrophica bacterium]|nr:DUF503 domain-containing protein [Candidatus Omnitrophota bacterium]